MWESETDSVSGKDHANGVLSLSKHGLSSDGFELRGNSWYVSTDVPSDLIVGIGDYSFYLHKYMLLCKSAKMNRIIQEAHIPDLNKVVLDDLPGGSAAFELAAKFCYGIAFDLTASNVSSVRCAAEYLEMTEDLEEGNLIFKTEAFLSYVVLTSWRDSVIVLKGCEKLSPWPENLQIVRRCCESIAWKACADPKGIKWAYTGKPLNVSSLKWDDTRDSSPSRNQLVPPDWWFEDVSALRINHFVRVITAIKVKGMRVELTGAAIMHYAGKWLPGLVQGGVDAGEEGSITSFSHSSGHSSRKGEIQMITAGTTDELPMSQAKDQRLIIESLISILPPHKDSITCSFLLRLLRMANTLNVAPALVTELEKRVAVQFEQATLADLLIPSYNKGETIYDVDVVQRLLEHFLVQEQTESPSPSRKSFSDKQVYDGTQRKSFSEKQLYDGAQRITNQNAKMRVARLVDSYLTEVAKDKNLTLTKFQALAEALPESARTCDDGLYRAIDSYLKAHPMLSEHERKRLCRVMDCQKLSMDACIHAAQNERLPLRVVVQVLLSEQVKISNAVTNNSLKVNGEAHYQPLVPNRKAALEGTPLSYQEGWTVSRKDINTLKFELESMKAKYLELQNDFVTLQRQFDKLSKQKHSSAWTSGWKKLSKLTRKSTAGNQVIEHHLTETVEHIEDAPKRWRNSVS